MIKAFCVFVVHLPVAETACCQPATPSRLQIILMKFNRYHGYGPIMVVNRNYAAENWVVHVYNNGMLGTRKCTFMRNWGVHVYDRWDARYWEVHVYDRWDERNWEVHVYE